MFHNEEKIQHILGIIGNVISFGLFLSPLPTFCTIIKKRAVENFSPIPYLATMLNCAMWVFYGSPAVKPNSTLVWTINSIGLILETIYLVIFFTFATRRPRLKVAGILTGEAAFMAVMAACVLSLQHTHKDRMFSVGIMCIIFGTCMYAAPLSVMAMVIRTKSVKYMPFTISFVSFLNGVIWTAYALLPFDVNMVIPNGLGTFFCFCQLILYGCYYRTTNWDEDDCPTIKPEIQMPSIKPSVASSVVPLPWWRHSHLRQHGIIGHGVAYRPLFSWLEW